MTIIIVITITSLHYIILYVPKNAYEVLNNSLLKISHESINNG